MMDWGPISHPIVDEMFLHEKLMICETNMRSIGRAMDSFSLLKIGRNIVSHGKQLEITENTVAHASKALQVNSETYNF